MSVAAFIGSQRTEHDVPHAVSCRPLGLSESWFYKWHNRLPAARQVRRAELADELAAPRLLQLQAARTRPVRGSGV